MPGRPPSQRACLEGRSPLLANGSPLTAWARRHPRDLSAHREADGEPRAISHEPIAASPEPPLEVQCGTPLPHVVCFCYFDRLILVFFRPNGGST